MTEETTELLRKVEYPKLYALSSTGKLKEWQILVEELEDGTAQMIRRFGQVGGKIRNSIKNVKKGKNIGKANETDPFQQASSQAISEINLQRQSNYVPFEIDKKNYVPKILLPQLAKGPKKGKIKFPCDMQPKLNGICCIARSYYSPSCFKQFTSEYIDWATKNGLFEKIDKSQYEEGIAYHSRGGHLFKTLEHFTPFLKFVLPINGMVHGELYNHDWSLQKIGSYTKDLKPDADKLEFWVYDLPHTKLRWLKRREVLNKLINPVFSPTIRLVDTVTVNSYEEAKDWHDKWVAEGFEGGMLRNHNGYYIFQYNSNDLEKVKEFEDDEFEIVGGKEGTGTDEGCIVFRCVTSEGLEFDVRPKGTVEKRKEMYNNLDKYIGEKLTTRFSEYSEDMIPQQPVGVAVRNYE